MISQSFPAGLSSGCTQNNTGLMATTFLISLPLFPTFASWNDLSGRLLTFEFLSCSPILREMEIKKESIKCLWNE
jgi:hypothetical protein